jgi:bacterioferritin-associated ferredoxin
MLIEALTTLSLRSVTEVRQHTGAGEGCTACHATLRQYIEEYVYPSASPICSLK